jgi:hypothetical protein
MKIDLKDPRCLIKVRRKMAHAVEAAQEANERHAKKSASAFGVSRPWSLCYPTSIGATTQEDVRPDPGPRNAEEAHFAAMGDPLFVACREHQKILTAQRLKVDHVLYPTLAAHGVVHA